MAHVSEDYGAAPPGAAAVRAPEAPNAAGRSPGLPGLVAKERAAKGRATRACVASVRRKIGALCPAPLKALPA
jgi:hypothetical protein